jgi:hypothetical protein
VPPGAIRINIRHRDGRAAVYRGTNNNPSLIKTMSIELSQSYIKKAKSSKTLNSNIELISSFLDDPSVIPDDIFKTTMWHLVVASSTGNLTYLYVDKMSSMYCPETEQLIAERLAKLSALIDKYASGNVDNRILILHFAQLLRINKPDLMEKMFYLYSGELKLKFTDFIVFHPKSVKTLPFIQAVMLFL